jgi:hypothetical protein
MNGFMEKLYKNLFIYTLISVTLIATMIPAYLSRIKDSLFKAYLSLFVSKRVICPAAPGAGAILSSIKNEFYEKDTLYNSLHSLGELAAPLAGGHYPIVILRGGMPLLLGLDVKNAGYIAACSKSDGAGRVIHSKRHGPLKDKKVLIIDDIIADGDTIILALDYLRGFTADIDILAAIITSKGYFRLMEYLDSTKLKSCVYCFELTSDSHFLHELHDMGDRIYGKLGAHPEGAMLRLADEFKTIFTQDG